jgi:hypothetical protein
VAELIRSLSEVRDLSAVAIKKSGIYVPRDSTYP